MMRTLLIFLTLLLSGLIAGFFFAFSVDVNLATAELTAASYIQVQQLINVKVRNLPFAAVYFGAALAPAVLLSVSWRRWRSASWRMLAAGFLLYFLGAFLFTREINVPINEMMARWNPAAPPADWAMWRERWNQANLFRTVVSILSFGCYLGALMLDAGTARRESDPA